MPSNPELRTAAPEGIGQRSVWATIWPTAVFLGFGLLFVAGDPAVRGFTLGPVLILLVSVAVLAWRSARPSVGGAGPAAAETDAWYVAQVLLACVIFLQMIAAGRRDEGFDWLLLFAYGGVVVLAPELRKRRLAEQARHRGVVEDERDAAIQAAAMRWAKRTLEFLVVVGAAVYAIAASRSGVALDARFTVAAVFAAMFTANAIGQWRAATLYWRDRR